MNTISSRSSSDAVKHLISINIVVYAGIFVFSRYGLDMLLALYNPFDVSFEFYQPLTHMFVHSRELFVHILFNMLALWMFGAKMEQILGSRKFLVLYFISGIAAGLFQIFFNMGIIYNYAGTLDFSQISHDEILYNALSDKQRAALQLAMYAPMMGASGAVAGVVGAFARFFPDNKIFIMPFPFPIAVRKALMFFVVISLVLALFNLSSGVAHFAHIGGTIAGYSIAGYYLRGAL
ncbi:rhomboid family intramembrane serine protease [Bacteroidetes bacterium endosymbiont of Geopemphigus sp.]|uniref:rhomboid family intramembrane serine protease n=1 Tax=Bacteroidetes bacterium endosymbiont of Geopemphigus sp. TaxID=2047937 RepID=UPI000CD01950|nr:rhomboid family intramembrane serine protease [Bacteroidetes bacterium endosymbiont of Geopemphigus sp.]